MLRKGELVDMSDKIVEDLRKGVLTCPLKIGPVSILHFGLKERGLFMGRNTYTPEQIINKLCLNLLLKLIHYLNQSPVSILRHYPAPPQGWVIDIVDELVATQGDPLPLQTLECVLKL